MLGAEVAYVGQKTDGSLPNITGVFRVDFGRPTYTATGCFYDAGGGAELRGNTAASNCGMGFDASRCSSVYTNGQTRVKSAGVYVMYCIKY